MREKDKRGVVRERASRIIRIRVSGTSGPEVKQEGKLALRLSYAVYTRT